MVDAGTKAILNPNPNPNPNPDSSPNPNPNPNPNLRREAALRLHRRRARAQDELRRAAQRGGRGGLRGRGLPQRHPAHGTGHGRQPRVVS